MRIVQAFQEEQLRVQGFLLEELTGTVINNPIFAFNEAMRYIWRTKRVLMAFCTYRHDIMGFFSLMELLGQ
jgi:hypothetical protein